MRASSQESRGSLQKASNRAVAQVNHLEVPAELAFVLSKLETWEVVNAPDKHLAKMSGPLPMMPLAKKLPHDIDYYAFSKGKKSRPMKCDPLFLIVTLFPFQLQISISNHIYGR